MSLAFVIGAVIQLSILHVTPDRVRPQIIKDVLKLFRVWNGSLVKSCHSLIHELHQTLLTGSCINPLLFHFLSFLLFALHFIIQLLPIVLEDHSPVFLGSLIVRHHCLQDLLSSLRAIEESEGLFLALLLQLLVGQLLEEFKEQV